LSKISISILNAAFVEEDDDDDDDDCPVKPTPTPTSVAMLDVVSFKWFSEFLFISKFVGKIIILLNRENINQILT
jgi:hypothetical protein